MAFSNVIVMGLTRIPDLSKIESAIESVQQKVNSLADEIDTVKTSVGTGLSTKVDGIVTGTTAIALSVGTGLKALVNSTSENVSDTFDYVQNTIKPDIDKIVTSVGTGLSSAVSAIQTSVGNGLHTSVAGISGVVQTIKNNVTSIGTDVTAIKTSVGTGLRTLTGAIGTNVGKVLISVGTGIGANVSTILSKVNDIRPTQIRLSSIIYYFILRNYRSTFSDWIDSDAEAESIITAIADDHVSPVPIGTYLAQGGRDDQFGGRNWQNVAGFETPNPLGQGTFKLVFLIEADRTSRLNIRLYDTAAARNFYIFNLSVTVGVRAYSQVVSGSVPGGTYYELQSKTDSSYNDIVYKYHLWAFFKEEDSETEGNQWQESDLRRSRGRLSRAHLQKLENYESKFRKQWKQVYRIARIWLG